MPDDIDAGTSQEGTQPTASDAAADTGTADAGTQETQQADSQVHNGTTTTTSQAEGEAQAQSPTGDEKPANPWESPENPYFKRFNDTQSHATRLYQQNQQLARQSQEYQERIARFEQQQKEQADKAKLSPFQKAHPEYGQNRDRLNRVSAFRAALSSFDNPDDATMRRLAQNMGISQKDLELERDAESYRQRLDEEWRADPEGFVQSRVESKIQEALGNFENYLNSRSGVERLISDPGNAKLIESYAPQMSMMMDQNVPARDKAFTLAQVMAERDALKAKLGQQVEQVSHAEAQQSFARPQQKQGSNGRRQASQYPAEAQADPRGWLLKKNPNMSQDQLITEMMKINNYFDK